MLGGTRPIVATATRALSTLGVYCVMQVPRTAPSAMDVRNALLQATAQAAATRHSDAESMCMTVNSSQSPLPSNGSLLLSIMPAVRRMIAEQLEPDER
jgi:hypothetical protein